MRSVLTRLLAAALILGLPTAPAQALPAGGMRSIEATQWAYLYAGADQPRTGGAAPQANEGPAKSTFIVNYSINFPNNARLAFDKAVSIWGQNFSSPVPIVINATWTRLGTGVLGSARPIRFFTNFDNAPARDLWYTSTMANALAGRDLDPTSADISANFSSTMAWSYSTTGIGYPGYYDFVTVVLHEIGHGLGFLSNTYQNAMGDYVNDQPTPFDALVKPDFTDLKLADLPTGSADLAKAMVSPMAWVGAKANAANNGVPPKIYSPRIYESGSSTSHLDEVAFNNSYNSLMTPVLNSNEVISEPGPLTMAMFADMMGELPAPKATAAPGAPQRVTALTGERSAIVSFDPPQNNRNSQVVDYTIEVVGGAIAPITAKASPVTITGLQQGTSYIFTVKANNAIGSSAVAYSNSVLISRTWSVGSIDAGADGTFVASTTWRGSTVIGYTDVKSGELRMALWNGKKWVIQVVDGNGLGKRTANDVSGQISLCTTGSGTTQALHFFYPDLIDRDLRHATYNGKAFSYEVVDGNAASAQKIEETARVRTSNDVSVSNACVSTSDGLQVFYRDETLGILLGAVKKTTTWRYELIDGDRDADGRTTGDVGFRLKALAVDRVVHIVYDSYWSFDSQHEPLKGDARYATRTGGAANSWNYYFLQTNSSSYPVAGYDVAIGLNGKRIFATWLAATPTSGATPVADTLRIAEITSYGPTSTRTVLPREFGRPAAPLSIGGGSVAYGCQERLCSATLSDGTRALLTGQKVTKGGASVWIKRTVGKVTKTGVVLGVNGKLAFVTN